MLRKTPLPAEQRASLVVSQTIDLSTFPDPYAMEAIGNCLAPFVETEHASYSRPRPRLWSAI
jgi:hypothetical protein